MKHNPPKWLNPFGQSIRLGDTRRDLIAGDSNERVDTPKPQLIVRFACGGPPIRIAQQTGMFIDASAPTVDNGTPLRNNERGRRFITWKQKFYPLNCSDG